MKKDKVFKTYRYIIFAIIFFLLDFGLTWYYLNYSSDASEGNPLFSIDDGYLVLVINFIYLILIFIIEKFIINKYETINIHSKNSFDYFKNLYKSDKNNFIVNSFVFALVISTLSSRLMAIIDWIVYGVYKSRFKQTKYAIIREKMLLQRFDPVVGLIMFVVTFILWYKLEYNKMIKVSVITIEEDDYRDLKKL